MVGPGERVWVGVGEGMGWVGGGGGWVVGTGGSVDQKGVELCELTGQEGAK